MQFSKLDLFKTYVNRLTTEYFRRNHLFNSVLDRYKVWTECDDCTSK